MSLSVPYVLRAALDAAPSLVVLDDERCDVRAVEWQSREQALVLWRNGHRPGGRFTTQAPVTQLAAARLGLILIDQSDNAQPDQDPGHTCDLDVVETTIWSETLLAHADGEDLTHGRYLDLLDADLRPPALVPLSRILIPILGARRRADEG